MIVAEETAGCHVAHGEEDGELEAEEAEEERVEEEDADVEEYQVAIGRWARSEGREETSGGKVLAEEGNKKKMRWGKSEENNSCDGGRKSFNHGFNNNKRYKPTNPIPNQPEVAAADSEAALSSGLTLFRIFFAASDDGLALDSIPCDSLQGTVDILKLHELRLSLQVLPC
ncbi:hypothetical protein LINPERHAP2_LOCUS34633 [Linum perenne]